MAHVRRWLGNGRGATVVEYLIILILAAIVVLAILRVFGGTVREKFGDANAGLAQDISNEKPQPGAGDGAGGASLGAKSAAAGNSAGTKAGATSNGRGAPSSNPAAGGNGARGSNSAAGSGPRGGRDGPAADANAAPGSQAGAPAASGPSARGKPEPRINPVILLFGAGLVLLLLYVMVSGKEG